MKSCTVQKLPCNWLMKKIVLAVLENNVGTFESEPHHKPTLLSFVKVLL